MATAVVPAPFTLGNRLIDGQTLDTNFAYPFLSTQDDITAGAGGTQANATQLVARINRVGTVTTSADSVKLPPSKPGQVIFITNASANSMQVFAYGTATINGIDGQATGVAQAAASQVMYTTSVTGKWYSYGVGTGGAGNYTGNFDGIVGANTPAAATVTTLAATGLVTLSDAATVSANAGGGQASGTALTKTYNLVTTVTSNFDSVKLITAAAGVFQTVRNAGASILSVFPNTSDAINGYAVNLSIDIPVGGEVTFFAIDATTWYTDTALDMPSPSTQKGNFVIKAADNASNVQVTLSNASFAQASVVSIPDVGAATGTLAALEATQTFTGTKTFSAIKRNKATNAITAFSTGGQGSATALTSEINSITTCAAAGDSVKLPTSVAGMMIQVSNLGATAAAVFPVSGDLIDSLAANASVSLAVGASIIFTCAIAGSWKSTQQQVLGAQFTTGTTTTTFTAGQLTGAQWVSYASTAGTPGSIATRTATQMFADDPYARVGGGYRLRVSNSSSGAAVLTITAGSGVTLTGTATVADTTYRDYVVTYQSATALTIQNVGSGSI